MALRRILTYPDTRLKAPATDVANLDGRVVQLCEDLAETMYAAPGIGLAATQVGEPLRVIVLDVHSKEEGPGKHLLKLVNPTIAERDGEIVFEEGCLSVPDFTAEVKRASRIVLRAWTPDEKEIELEAEGLLAVVFQHELDHLDASSSSTGCRA
jgi:peptide deformylase